MPDSDETSAGPPSLHVSILGRLRILMAGVSFFPARVQRHLPVLALILRALMRVQKKACIPAHPNNIVFYSPSCRREYSVALSRDQNPDASMVPQGTRFPFRPFFPSITGCSERRRDGPRIWSQVVHCHTFEGERGLSGVTVAAGHRAPRRLS